MVSMNVVEDLNEQLLADDETKDVEIEMSDGVMKAHSLILGISSQAIRGMLKHGMAESRKTLSWREHPSRTGRFFLRLMYTGTIDEDEWLEATPCQNTGEKQVPLTLLLGSLQIAKTYLVPHLLQVLTEALKRRVRNDTFDEILAHAVRLDVTALRLHCVRFAEDSEDSVPAGALVKATTRITVEHADVPKGTTGTVKWSPDGSLFVSWSFGMFRNSLDAVKLKIECVERPESSLHRLYDEQALSPEVMFELAALWGKPKPTPKKRRVTL
mmetsp:Transcript_123525/g.349207  ORF Transcript_123525/g.349207 Transcript_123525/m.349207 type:complete len:270 (+) Transcript_123525:161-970(+)